MESESLDNNHSMIQSDAPWFVRGGIYYNKSISDIFIYAPTCGSYIFDYSFCLVLSNHYLEYRR